MPLLCIASLNAEKKKKKVRTTGLLKRAFSRNSVYMFTASIFSEVLMFRAASALTLLFFCFF